MFGPFQILLWAYMMLSTVSALLGLTWRHGLAVISPTRLDDRTPKYGGIQHAGILVADTDLSKEFYMEIFGFQDESFMRPKTLPYPGAFLRCGSTQIHLMQLPSMDPKTGRPEHGGRDRHVALTVDNIDILRDRLVERGMAYTYSQSGRRALFCRDLDGNAYEFMEDTSLA